MNLRLQMVDADTGEILVTRYKEFACSFATKNDAGFRTCVEWCMSAVRGVRMKKANNIELRIGFSENQGSLFLPFGMTENDAKNEALNYVR